MMTAMRLLPVRVSPVLHGLIDQVGPVNPATRALLVLGAAAAGLELRGLEREVAALLSAELDSYSYWLLHQVRAAAFGAALADFVAQGRPIYGGSAGAIVLGRDIVTCAHLDQNSVGLSDTAGLDLLGGAAVWCHYRAADDPQIEALVARCTMPVLAISERAGIAREGDELRSVGYEAAFRFTASGRERLAPGERLHL